MRLGLGFGRALSGAGCGRAAAVGAALLVAFGSTARSRWAAVPVDVESPPAVASSSELRADLEALLTGPRWTVEQRSRVSRAIEEEADAAGLDPLLVMAVLLVESRANDLAVSDRGAIGLMQLRPPTMRFIAGAEGVGLPPGDASLSDPALNVRLGIRYLDRLHRAFGDLGLALVAYNAGPHRVSELRRAGKPIPERLRAYPRKVRSTYLRLVTRLGGDVALAARGFPLGPQVAAR